MALRMLYVRYIIGYTDSKSLPKELAMDTAALIIAAGNTPRKKGFEPQHVVGTISAIQRVVKIFHRAGIERIIVICDRMDTATEKLATHMGAVFLHSPMSADMLDSVKVGLEYLKDKCSAVLVTHVDAPLFSVDTVCILIRTAESVGIPSYRGNKGHPILIRSEHFPSVLSYSGSGGLAGAVRALNLGSNTVDVDDEGILADIQSENDYERLLSRHSLAELCPEIQIRLAREKAFYGPGAHQLLKLTDETSSLSEACRQMGISSSKGRAIIALIEQQLRRPVIEGQAGGKSGGYSILTHDGKELIRNYTKFCAEAKQCLNDLFIKHWSCQ